MCKQILFVDDNPLMFPIIKSFIKQKFNIEVDYCDCVQDAIRKISMFEYCAVVTDISLPGQSGHVLVDYLINKKVPVIVVTAHPRNIALVDKRVNAFFQKPIDKDSFCNTLRNLCKIQDLKYEEIENHT